MSDTLFILSGAPGAGKSTLLEYLNNRHGLRFVEEGGRAIIRQQMACGGDALPWARREAFCQKMFEHALESREQALKAGGTWLLDRGLPDVLGYARLCGLPISAELAHAALKLRYAQTVFLTPPWEDIYRNDTERRQDFTEARRTAAVMREVYEELGYRIVELPLGSLEARASFLLPQLIP